MAVVVLLTNEMKDNFDESRINLMRDPNRIYKFCNQLAEIWITQCPDWRFGQLVLNIFQSGEVDKHIPFYIEDEDMMEYIKRYFKIEEAV